MIRSLFDSYSIKQMSIASIETNSWPIETRKTEFSVEFSSNYISECLKRFQALWTVLWNILTLYTCLLMKYNPMSINRGLCKQKWEWFQEVSNREIQEILWLFSRIAICRT